MKNVAIEEPTSFLDHVYLECAQRECKPNDTTTEQYKKCLNHVFLLEQQKNYQDGKSHMRKLQRRPTTWKDMLKNVWNEIANWQIRGTAVKKRYPVLAWTITKSKKRKSLNQLENCHKSAHKLSKNDCTWQELVEQTFCRQSTNFRDLSQNGLKLVTDDWPDQFPKFTREVITANIVMWVTRQILRTQNQHQVEFCAFSEVEHLYQSVGSAKSTP